MGLVERGTRRGRALLVRGLSERRALALGIGAVVVLAAAVAPFGDDLGHAAEGLVLVMPVMLTAALGGRRPAWVVAVAATVGFVLVLPPVGTFRLDVAEDAVALAVFLIVAVTVGGLVASRIDVLARIERQRAGLLRSVSHDLRTPLGSIRAAASELLDDEGLGDADRDRLLVLVEGEAERLDRLVGNLLSLARIEADGLVPRRQAVDLGEVVEVAVARLRRGRLAAEVHVDRHPDLPVLLGDHTLLEQMVTNLVENAARHSPPAEPVEVTVRPAGHDVELVVADAGPGVAPEDVPTIFEPFRTAGPHGQSGIGLAICRAVVEAHAGTIAVRGSSRGGAELVVTLPLR